MADRKSGDTTGLKEGSPEWWAEKNYQSNTNTTPTNNNTSTTNNNTSTTNNNTSTTNNNTSTAIDFGGRIQNDFSREWYRSHGNSWNGYDAYMVALMGQQNTTDANKVITPPVTTTTNTGTNTTTTTPQYVTISAPLTPGNGVNIPTGSIIAVTNGMLDLTKPYTLPDGQTRAALPWATPIAIPGNATVSTGTGTSGTGTSGSNNDTAGPTAADRNATAALITATQNAAIAAAGVYGYMVKPVYGGANNAGIIIGWDPILDTSGNKIPTLTAGQPAAQIALYNAQAAKEAASAVEAYAKAYGKVKDPQTGEWVATSDKLVADTTQALNLANARRLDEQTATENRNYLAQALADPNRFVEAFGLAQLQGARAGGTAAQPGGLWGQAQNYISTLPVGTQNVMAQSTVPGAMRSQSYGANGQPLIALNDNPVNTTGQLANLAQNTLLPVSGNLNAALGGQYVPTAGNASGSQGQVQSLASVMPAYGNFAKISPVVFRNLDTATQGQYGSLAQSIQGINAADLKQRVNAQLPGSSGGIPSAFRL